MQLSYANLRYEEANIAYESNPDKHSLETVGILKKATDMEEKYLIYKTNNSQFNNEPDYMFKISTLTQVKVKMDQDGPEKSLARYGSILQWISWKCFGYKTLTMFVYQPAIWYILRFAAMEVKRESTCEISFFWKLFNEIFSQITERLQIQYKSNNGR